MNEHDNPESPIVLLRRLHRWRMAFFGLVILLAGMLAGAAATLITISRPGREGPPPPETAVMRMLDQVGPRLRLSAEQRQQMGPILEKHMARLHEIWEDGRAQIAQELKRMNEEISVVLDENQRRLWEQFLQGLPGQFRHGLGPGPRGRGPGLGPPGRPGPRRGRPTGPSDLSDRPMTPQEEPAQKD